jgi:hypothetical protein
LRDTPSRLLCEDKHQVPDSVDVKSVMIYTVLGAFQQPDQPFLPDHFTPDVTVSAGPPPSPSRVPPAPARGGKT